jgi:hypothetical protein
MARFVHTWSTHFHWQSLTLSQDPEDLQFSKGDVIEIVEEVNADWYRGRLNGKQGLVPSAYVENIAPVAKATKPYKPFAAAYHGMTAPPPPGEGTNHIGLQEKAGTEEKKDKMGRYKNTVSHGFSPTSRKWRIDKPYS